MPFVKVVKNKAYFKRFQVAKRRRREGKTDYHARRKMVKQDKNKYNSPKYRLIVRFTATRCICQIAYATILGDRTVCQASSDELPKYGVPCGLTNYAAAYCTGLLIARRHLKTMGLDGDFAGKETIDGDEYHIEDEDTERKPFKCVLDVGLVRTTIGHRVFGALKGAADGGLHVPHSEKRFPGYKAPEEKGADAEYEAEVHKDRIFGKHLAEYMEMLEEEDPTKYEAHFSQFLKNDLDGGKLEDMYADCHAKIKEDPSYTPKESKDVKNTRSGNKITTSNGNSYARNTRLNLKQRKEKVRQKIAAAQAKMLKAAEEEEDDE